ncbi:MAG: hypothetical protein ASARMPRED_005762 [Alectoria sarmentosa]|nr:MAG: hypothetical protein ASARMPRED_005762 [Alectoria sarmentosa]
MLYQKHKVGSLGIYALKKKNRKGLALAALGGVIVANAQNGYSLDSDAIPDAGYDASSTCTYAGANATNEAAAAPAWISSMTGCLDALNAENWNGNECAPPVGGMTFGFWKGENDYSDGVDCYNRMSIRRTNWWGIRLILAPWDMMPGREEQEGKSLILEMRCVRYLLFES